MKRAGGQGKSAVTNGTRLYLKPVDGRTEEARRFADILRAIEEDHGGRARMGEMLWQTARGFAQLCVERELMEMTRAAGGEIDVELYGGLCERINRQAARLNRKEAKPDKPKSSLRDRLAARSKGADA